MQYKNFSFEVKEVDEKDGTFMGYASVFGNIDLEHEMVMPGAFTKTLKERGERVPICWQHDWKQPIGKPILTEDAHGLLVVKGKISDTQAGRDALTLLRDGVVQDLSIGYDVIKDDYAFFDEKGQEAKKAKNTKRVRKLHELRLYEVSLVTVGANDAATVLDVKSLEDHVELKGAIPYKKTPLASKDTPWDAAAEKAKCEGVDDLRAICALVDGDPENRGSYKLPHHKGDGNHACVWNGVKAAAGALRGARGGVEGGGQSGARGHIGKHYADFDETPPWKSGGGEESQSEEPEKQDHSQVTLETKRRELRKRLVEELIKE